MQCDSCGLEIILGKTLGIHPLICDSEFVYICNRSQKLPLLCISTIFCRFYIVPSYQNFLHCHFFSGGIKNLNLDLWLTNPH